MVKVKKSIQKKITTRKIKKHSTGNHEEKDLNISLNKIAQQIKENIKGKSKEKLKQHRFIPQFEVTVKEESDDDDLVSKTQIYPGVNIKNEMNEDNEFVSKNQIKSAVAALLTVVANRSKNNKLFNEIEPILLQVTPVRIPKVPRYILRFALPNSLVTETSDVCLFVPDLHKGRKTDHEPTIQHYEDLLRAKGVKNIRAIIPMRQVKVEYDQFELRRKLLSQYDFFLTEGRISKHLNHKLGGLFKKKRKCPTPVRLDAVNLKLEIDSALHKVPMPLSPDGDSQTVTVGHTQLKLAEICENICAVIKSLSAKYPGGWANIRSLYIKTELSIAIPIYISLKHNKEVKIPVIQPKRPKDYEPVEGELTTRIGRKAIVYPGGRVDVVQESDPSNLSDESELSENEDFVDGEENLMSNSSKRKKDTPENDDSDNEGESESLKASDSEVEESDQQSEYEEKEQKKGKKKKRIGNVEREYLKEYIEEQKLQERKNKKLKKK